MVEMCVEGWFFGVWNDFMGCKKYLAEDSFDLSTSGLWAQHASTAPLCFTCEMSLRDTV